MNHFLSWDGLALPWRIESSIAAILVAVVDICEVAKQEGKQAPSLVAQMLNTDLNSASDSLSEPGKVGKRRVL